MSKFTKTITIIAVSMLIIGIPLAIIGFFSGAHLSLTRGTDGFKIYDTSERKQETFELDAFKNIDSSLANADISIIPSNSFKVVIDRNDDEEITHSLENETLVISEKDTNKQKYTFNFGFTGWRPTIVKIYVPHKTNLSKISLFTTSGDIKVSNIKSDSLAIDTNYGDVVLDNITTNENTISLKDGDVLANDIISKKFILKTLYGDLALNHVQSDLIEVTSNDGDVTFDNVNTKENQTKTNYGDITFRNYTSSGSTIQTDDGDIIIEGTLKGDTSINSIYGDINLKLTNSRGGLSYSVTNSVGDIIIHNRTYSHNYEKDNNTKDKLKVKATDGDIIIK